MQQVYDKEILGVLNSTNVDRDAETIAVPRNMKKKREMKAERKSKLLSSCKLWTNDETEKLIEALKEHGQNWPLVTAHVGTKRKKSVQKQVRFLKKEA